MMESELEIFKRLLTKYLNEMAEKQLQPDGEAAVWYLEAELERELIISGRKKPR